MAITAGNMANLFGNSQGTSLSSSISNYNLLKSGSYSKMMKSYYANEKKNASSKADSAKASEEKKELQMTSSDANSLKTTLKDLLKEDNFEKKAVKNEDGTTTMKYDMDDLYKKASAYVKSYNEMLDTGADSTNTSVLRGVSSMTGRTKANERVLNSVGIKIGADNKLSIDEDKFKDEKNINSLKTLFQGYGSYGQQMQTKATAVENAASSALKKTPTYTNTASARNADDVGSLFEGMM